MNSISLLKNNNDVVENNIINDIILFIFNNQQQTNSTSLNANFEILKEAILRNSGFANAKYIEPILKTYNETTGNLQTISLDYNLNDFEVINGALSLISNRKIGKWFAPEVDTINYDYFNITDKEFTFATSFEQIIDKLINNDNNFENRVKEIIDNYVVSWDDPDE